MEKFEFYNPVRLVFGPGEIKRVGELAKSLGKKTLVVSYKDPGVLSPWLEKVSTSLETVGVGCSTCFEISANPTLEQVRKCVMAAKENKVDFIIGMGGGSAMDAAKIASAGVLYKYDLWNMIVARHDKIIAIPPEQALPTLMIPTLPATSSEMNCGAVVTNEKTLEKSYVFHPCLYPKISILDPEITVNLPPYQTACGAADAISHVMELYLNGVDDTPLQDRLMEGIVTTIMEEVRKALADPGDIRARAHLQWAAVVAWNGWTIPGTASATPMHMLAHVLSARYNLTHGTTLSIIMPAWMKYFYRYRIERYVQFAQRVLGMQTVGKKPETVAVQAIDAFEEFLKEIGVETRLSQRNIPERNIDVFTEDVVKIAFTADGKLQARPPATKEDVKRVFKLAY